MKSLTDCIVGELTDLRRFCALLDEERGALTGAQADRLPDLANEKSQLAARLAQTAARRDALLAGAGFAKGRPGMQAWLNAAAGDGERRCWAEILERAAQAREENETNGRLIHLLLKQNQDALAVLLSGDADSIYGADGQQRGPTTGKRSFGAV